jgi:hypothetical protein
MDLQSRRRFLALLPGVLVTLTAATPRTRRTARRGPHPQPRPGIDASRVTPSDKVTHGSAREFGMVREMPKVIDGIRCHCGCADVPDHYSLLSCYEGEGMAQHCQVCRGQVRLAHRLHKRGRDLDEIRAAVDAEYGS